MYYKCVECGHIFEEGERSRWTEDHGEKWDGCPLCRGCYEEYVAEICSVCEKKDDFIYLGLCKECLIDKINYENGFDYICETKNLSYFIFEYFYKMDYPKVTTAEFDEELRMIFLRKKVEDLALGKKALLEMIVDFIKDNDITGFADFLQERGEID